MNLNYNSYADSLQYSKHCALNFLQGSYLTVTSIGLFLFKSFEKRRVQRSDRQNYFKTNQIAGSGDYVKLFLGKY